MPKEWTDKDERQYEHVKDSAKSQGASTKRAKEMAARTVNKNRAQEGKTKTASRTSIRDKSPQQRGGQRLGVAGRRARPGISCTTRRRSGISRAAPR